MTVPSEGLEKDDMEIIRQALQMSTHETAGDALAALDRLWILQEKNDPDYSPAYQDEYQRLWHEAAVQRDEARQERDALLMAPGCACGTDDVCAFAARTIAAEAEVARLTTITDAARAYREAQEISDRTGAWEPAREAAVVLDAALASVGETSCQ